MPDARALDNWVEAFLRYTAPLPSPEIYRRWTGLATVAGALERRVWTRLSGSELYPNCFILLVGPAGVGKSMSVKEAHSLWAETGSFNVAPSGMTKAAFLDQLVEKPKIYEGDGATRMYNGMLIAATEFGTLFPDYDPRFLSTIIDTYDAGPVVEDRTRGGGLLRADRPIVSMVSGTTPQYLGGLLPERAWGEGFTSRLVMIYAGERVVVDVFKQANRPPGLRAKLVADLAVMNGLTGEFEWEEAAKEAVEEWNRHPEVDAPQHPRLIRYCIRRIVHAVKLAMAISVARSNDLIVTLKDFESAKSQLLAAENVMPEIFKEMSVSQDANEINEMHEFLFAYCMNHHVNAVPEYKLVQFIAQRVPVNRIDYFVEALLRSNLMESTGLNLKDKRMFKPKPLSALGEEG